MDFTYRRSYCGPLQAVILDWAGTTVDYGAFAPAAVFLRIFDDRGVPINVEQARAPMGLMKKDHLRAIAESPDVARRWQEVHGKPCSAADIDAMFTEFSRLQIACLADYASSVPGALEAIAEFHRLGLKIGSTTGYTCDMMDVLVPEAARRGYSPDCWVCPSDVPAGRPFPYMCYLNAIRLQVYPMQAMVKVGDTLPDIEEGLNAGMWTVGVALSGNMMGLTHAGVTALTPSKLNQRRKQISSDMYEAGAHFVVDTIAGVPSVLEEIQSYLRSGERP